MHSGYNGNSQPLMFIAIGSTKNKASFAVVVALQKKIRNKKKWLILTKPSCLC